MKYEFSDQIRSNRTYDPLKRRNHATVCLAFAQPL
jgi:hypothetical protein